jgi:hypothetical protein
VYLGVNVNRTSLNTTPKCNPRTAISKNNKRGDQSSSDFQP